MFGMDNIEHDIECKKSIGFAVDECCFHNCLNAYNINNIMCGIYKEWDESKFMSYLSQFIIKPQKKISDLSKGMKSKLMLAIAMSHNPKFLILDEITSGLDPVIRDDILLILKDYVSKTNSSVLFSTHVTSDLDRIADEIAFLHEGNLIFYETTQALKEQYKLVQCSAEHYENLPKANIKKVLVRAGMYSVLVSGDINASLVNSVGVPSIDDIMLLYIKGENAL